MPPTYSRIVARVSRLDEPMTYTAASPRPPANAGGFNLDHALRRVFPSTSRLTFNPMFRWTVNTFDAIPRLVFPEFRGLPPNHLRIRSGVGNRILNNQTHFLVHARDFWMFVFSEHVIGMNADIVDIGVGCGRWLHWLRDYNFRNRRFTGTYVGVDVDGEAVDWCRRNYDGERFRFHHSSDASVSYDQAGSGKSYRIPEADGTFDLVFSNSLLTHLLQAELENYVRESYRLLKPHGTMMHTIFNIEHPPATLGTRHTFSHPRGDAMIESEAQPEAAVAYHSDFLLSLCRRVGFSDCEIIYMPSGAQHQPVLFCRK
jgi:SAM-dependent methyltransferase